ncbi:hypothetical protein SMDB11_4449 [Serratia marcescens subsp. marcescens Db11]|uniref:Uncharacterized protein n=1 Tax=Serratia marcescens subsp. marcescens Db11 TaxID=273526 RepID=A0ABC9IQU9_SERMA|nr:hypothetical protein SMDB11_4449 [Serratia marcescens subsp. marcescens Db11]
MAGFSLSGVRTLHRTAFDYSAKGLTLRASAGCPSPVALFRRTRLWRFFAFWRYGLSIELRSILRLHSVSHGLSTIIPTTTEPLCGKPPLGQPIVAFACAAHVCKRSKYSAEITAAPDKTDPLHRPWVYSAERDLIHPDISLMKNMIIF